MKYPYIGQLTNKGGFVALFAGSGFACNLSNPEGAWSDAPLNDFVSDWHEDAFKNITTEYLANTYGKVESKEHAEFIVELCKVNGIDFLDDYEGGVMWFNCKCGLLDFYIDKNTASNDGEKLITIPLPPKQIQTATSEEEFEMQQIMKNNGDNLVLGCEDSKREEWPCVGDKFIHKGELVTCISKGVMSKGDEVITFEGADKLSHGSCWNIDAWVKKPKTPEEELREWLQERIGYGIASGFDCDAIAHDLLHHLKITKKPQ